MNSPEFKQFTEAAWEKLKRDRLARPRPWAKRQGGMADVARLTEGKVRCAACHTRLSMDKPFHEDEERGVFMCEPCSNQYA